MPCGHRWRIGICNMFPWQTEHHTNISEGGGHETTWTQRNKMKFRKKICPLPLPSSTLFLFPNVCKNMCFFKNRILHVTNGVNKNGHHYTDNRVSILLKNHSHIWTQIGTNRIRAMHLKYPVENSIVYQAMCCCCCWVKRTHWTILQLWPL